MKHTKIEIKEESIIFCLIMNAQQDNKVLRKALRNTYRMLKHSEEYISVLQENMTDDEYDNSMNMYDEISASYVRKPEKLSPFETASEAKTVLNAIGETLGSDDIAEILNLDVMDVEMALRQHTKRK